MTVELKRLASDPLLPVALAVLLGLQATRAFFGYLVWYVGETTDPVTLGLLAYAVFLGGLLVWVPWRLLGDRRTLLASVALLAVTRVGDQALRWPGAEVVLTLLGSLALWWALLLLGRLAPRAIGPGLAIGLALDVAVRTFGLTVDLPWHYGALPLALTLLLGLAAMLGAARIGPDGVGRTPLAGLAAWGALLFFHFTLSGNLGEASARLGAAFPATAWTLAAGTLLGLLLLGTDHVLVLAVVGLAGLYGIQAGLPGGPLWLILAAGPAIALATRAVAVEDRPGSLRRALAAYLAAALLLLTLAFAHYATYTQYTFIPILAGLAALGLGVLEGRRPVALRGPEGRRPATGDPGLGEDRPRSAPRLSPALVAAVLLVIAAGWRTLTWRTLTPQGQAPRELTVVAYNIRHGFGARTQFSLEEVARVIEEARPDLVGLSEVQRGWLVTNGVDIPTWLSQRLGMPAHFGPAGDGGNALLTPYAATVRNLPLKETQAVPRAAILAEVATQSGPLSVAVVHLDHPDDAQAARLAQIEEILAAWRPQARAVLVGDLNAEPEDEELARLYGLGLVDAAARAGAAEATSPAEAPRRRIDYVLVTPDIEVLSARAPRTLASDHLPVVARLRLP